MKKELQIGPSVSPVLLQMLKDFLPDHIWKPIIKNSKTSGQDNERELKRQKDKKQKQIKKLQGELQTLDEDIKEAD